MRANCLSNLADSIVLQPDWMAVLSLVHWEGDGRGQRWGGVLWGNGIGWLLRE